VDLAAAPPLLAQAWHQGLGLLQAFIGCHGKSPADFRANNRRRAPGGLGPENLLHRLDGLVWRLRANSCLAQLLTNLAGSFVAHVLESQGAKRLHLFEHAHIELSQLQLHTVANDGQRLVHEILPQGPGILHTHFK